MQDMAFEDNLKDIPWNFMVGDDGFVYEGRGFRFQGELSSNNSTSSFDETGIVVAFIGTFTEDSPSQEQVDTFTVFLEQSVSRDLVVTDFVLIVEDQLVVRKNPAQGLYDCFQNFNNFYNRKNRECYFKGAKLFFLTFLVQEVVRREDWGAHEPQNQSLVEKFGQPVNIVLVTAVSAKLLCFNSVSFALTGFGFL